MRRRPPVAQSTSVFINPNRVGIQRSITPLVSGECLDRVQRCHDALTIRTKESPIILLGPKDPPPYQILNEAGRAPLLLLCDHAGHVLPESMNGLGLSAAQRESHIGWDIGAAAVTRKLSGLLDAPAAFSTYSRLVIDPNRPLDHPAAFPAVSDGISVPGNGQLSDDERLRRARACYWPYHEAVQRQLAAFSARGIKPAVLSVHTCTPVFEGFERPWHVGIIWNRDPRLPEPLIEWLRRCQGIEVGDNQPYSGRGDDSFTLSHHAESADLAHAGIEIRQDLVGDADGINTWAARLAQALSDILPLGQPASSHARDAGGRGHSVGN